MCGISPPEAGPPKAAKPSRRRASLQARESGIPGAERFRGRRLRVWDAE
jgi:hypothetical protein